MTIEEVKNLLEFTRQQNHKILETLDAQKDPVMYGFRIGEETMLDYALELLGKLQDDSKTCEGCAIKETYSSVVKQMQFWRSEAYQRAWMSPFPEPYKEEQNG